jgi:hypothetical protein
MVKNAWYCLVQPGTVEKNNWAIIKLRQRGFLADYDSPKLAQSITDEILCGSSKPEVVFRDRPSVADVFSRSIVTVREFPPYYEVASCSPIANVKEIQLVYPRAFHLLVIFYF